MIKLSLSTLTLLLGLLLVPTMGRSEELMKEALNIDGQELTRCGESLLEWAGFLDIYTAAFYLKSADEKNWPGLEGGIALEILYDYGFKAQELADGADAILQRQLTAEQLEDLVPHIEQLHQAYRGVEPGDRYRLSFLPEHGSRLELNGALLVEVPGRDFARAYFGIWLEEKGINDGLAEELLSCLPRTAAEDR